MKGMWRVTRKGVCATVLLTVCSWAPAARACFFSDLLWSRDGTALYFLAGSRDDVRTLRYDLTSGSLEALDPMAHEPVWAANSGRILFHDTFGLYEIQPYRGGLDAKATMLLFLPQKSRYFLRAYGEDSRGQTLVWLLDQRTSRHLLATIHAGKLAPLPGSYGGVEALRAWEDRNRAQPFQDTGGRFVRSRCVQRPHRRDQLCLEIIRRNDMRISPFFRMTMGAPGSIDVLQNRCAPTSISPSRDSTRVIVGMFEDVDEDGLSETLSAWISNWEDAARVYETLLPSARPVRAHHMSWVLWLGREQAFWSDAVGQLWSVDVAAQLATPLLELPSLAKRSPTSRFVLGNTPDRERATGIVAQLQRRGFAAGLRRTAGVYEIQAGGSQDPRALQAISNNLRSAGFSRVQVLEGNVTELASGMPFCETIGPDGRSAFIRNVRTAEGVCSELWLLQDGESMLMVPALAARVPAGLE